jgi:hypothetical protein
LAAGKESLGNEEICRLTSYPSSVAEGASGDGKKISSVIPIPNNVNVDRNQKESHRQEG